MTEATEAADRDIADLLTSYIAGRLSPQLHVLVASQLEISDRYHAVVAAMEEDCGALLEDMPPRALGEAGGMLANIMSMGARSKDAAEIGHLANADGIPPSLSRYLGRPLASLPWRRVLPGLKEVRLARHDDGEASLLLVGAGRKMPAHTHAGCEVTLILKGSFRDDRGEYRRGDICIADSSIDHRPRAGDDQDCLCFAVTDAPLRLTGPFGRLIQPFLGS